MMPGRCQWQRSGLGYSDFDSKSNGHLLKNKEFSKLLFLWLENGLQVLSIFETQDASARNRIKLATIRGAHLEKLRRESLAVHIDMHVRGATTDHGSC